MREYNSVNNRLKAVMKEVPDKFNYLINKKEYMSLIELAVSLVTKNRKKITILHYAGGSWTDGQRINISVMDFMKEYSETDISKCIISLALHEAEHIVNSSFKALNNYENSLRKDYNTYEISIALNINNCIEDGRIERIDKIKYPNNNIFLDRMREIWYNSQPLSLEIDEEEFVLNMNQKTINDSLFAICTLATCSRLPLNWDNLYKNTKVDEFISKIKEHIKDGVLKNSHNECLEISNDIFNIFLLYFKDEIKLCSKHFYETTKLYGSILNGCEGSEFNHIADSHSENIMKGIIKSISDLDLKLPSSILGFSQDLTYKSTKVSSKKSNYNIDVKRLKKQIEKILDDKFSSRRVNLKCGTVNTNKLWKVALNEERIFKKNYYSKAKNTAIYLLIDSSGSMCGEKMNVANKLGAIVEEAFCEYINLEIAYFNDDHDVIRKFDSPDNNYFVCSYKKMAGGGNSDFENLKIAREILQKRDEEHKIIMIISDGLPCSNKNSSTPNISVKNEVLKAKFKGINTIAIALENNNPAYEEMYNHIVYTKVDNITNKLCKLIQKVIT